MKPLNLRLRATNDTDAAFAGLNRNIQATNRQMSVMRTGFTSNRRMIQGFGFQISDVAIQLAGGQMAMLALTQQVPQVLQMFGAFGAVLAVIAAVTGSVAIAMSKMNKGLGDILPVTGVLSLQLEAIGVVLRTVGNAFVWFANLVVNNLDVILIAAGVVGAYFAAGFVTSVLAAQVAVVGFGGQVIILSGVVGVFGAVLRALPFMFIVTAITGVIYAILRLTKGAKESGGIINLTGDLIASVWRYIASEAKIMELTVRSALAGMMAGLAEFGNAAGSKLDGAFKGVYAGIRSGLQSIGVEIQDLSNAPPVYGVMFDPGEWSRRADVFNRQAEAAKTAGSGFADMTASWNALMAAWDKGAGTDFDLGDMFGGVGAIEGAAGGAAGGVDKLADSLTKVEDKLAPIKSAFSGFFKSILDGSANAVDALRTLGANLMSMVTDKLINNFVDKLFGGMGGMFGGLFGGGGFLGGAGGGGLYARGTSNASGGWATVGERGPERINMRPGAKVLPYSTNGGGVVVQIINNTPAQVSHEQTRGDDGRMIQRIVIQEMNRATLQGATDGAQRARFGNNVRKVNR